MGTSYQPTNPHAEIDLSEYRVNELTIKLNESGLTGEENCELAFYRILTQINEAQHQRKLI